MLNHRQNIVCHQLQTLEGGFVKFCTFTMPSEINRNDTPFCTCQHRNPTSLLPILLRACGKSMDQDNAIALSLIRISDLDTIDRESVQPGILSPFNLQAPTTRHSAVVPQRRPG